MEMHEEQVGAVTALAVKGRLDSTTAPLLGARLESAMARPGASVVVDFVNLEYVSSAGFRVLLRAGRAVAGAARHLGHDGRGAQGMDEGQAVGEEVALLVRTLDLVVDGQAGVGVDGQTAERL